MKEGNVIVELTFDFALEVMVLCKFLTDRKEFVISRQLLKSATSIGANVEESIAAQSRNDFISKMRIASKESREARYWLKLLKCSNQFEYDFNKLLEKIDAIIRILTKIIKTSQTNSKFKIENLDLSGKYACRKHEFKDGSLKSIILVSV